MRFFALACFLLSAVCAFAQSPTDVFEKAPPEVDKALRERAAIFFQAHVDGKFRQAEKVIHEDSQDDFYNAEKQRLISFEITKISYSEKFTKAVLIATVELDWATARTGKIRVKPPMKTMWKLDKGEWWWYAPPRTSWDTPFGQMKPGADGKSGPAMPQVKMVDPNEVLNKIQASKSEIKLESAKKSEDTAQITADLPGEVRLEVRPHGIPGLNVSFENQTIRPGAPATIHFRYDPPDGTAKSPRIVYIHANPMAKVFSFTLNFAPPPAPSAAPLEFPGKIPTAPRK